MKKKKAEKSPVTCVAINELEAMVRGGCQSPDCKHKHSDMMYLNQRCHPKSGVLAHEVEGDLLITCAACNKPVVCVVLARNPVASKAVACECREACLEVSYTSGTGIVKVSCLLCKKHLVSFNVALVTPMV